LHASQQFPLELFVGDLDNNGSTDQVLAIEKNGKYYTFLGKEELEKQLPALMRKQSSDYSSLAGRTVDEIFGDKLQHTKKLTANTLASISLINDGRGKYIVSRLPMQLQWWPVFSFCDGFHSANTFTFLAAGNFYGVLPYEGRYDAGYGAVLSCGPSGNTTALPALESGFMPGGEVRDIKPIKTLDSKTIFAVARNNAGILFYRLKE
jgi:hypothetical protein